MISEESLSLFYLFEIVNLFLQPYFSWNGHWHRMWSIQHIRTYRLATRRWDRLKLLFSIVKKSLKKNFARENKLLTLSMTISIGGLLAHILGRADMCPDRTRSGISKFPNDTKKWAIVSNSNFRIFVPQKSRFSFDQSDLSILKENWWSNW